MRSERHSFSWRQRSASLRFCLTAKATGTVHRNLCTLCSACLQAGILGQSPRRSHASAVNPARDSSTGTTVSRVLSRCTRFLRNRFFALKIIVFTAGTRRFSA
jgi:hypothetical protein